MARSRGHRFHDLHHLICRRDWVEFALDAVLNNTGSRTAGVDGVTKKRFEEAEFRDTYVKKLLTNLKSNTYRPQPCRRHWIPKAMAPRRATYGSGDKRGLGIPTIQDRVVQMLLKMLLEPIFESDFLDCSNGFRPGRRTMDCVDMCFKLISSLHKYYWVIEGDISKCTPSKGRPFDTIKHTTLIRLIERRVDDHRIMALIKYFLDAGVMEDGLVSPTTEGTPQGGVVSPLLANIYLHEFDKWWWERMGKLEGYQKGQRRRKGNANYRLIRYADDFVILSNGTKEQAYAIRDEAQQFLKENLQLELNLDKTHVTHATDGFDFLGFHIQYMEPLDNKPWLRVTPADKTVERLKNKVREMTDRQQSYDTVLYKFMALNRVLRGWINYYRHVNAKRSARKLDWWVKARLVGWLEDKHGLGYRQIQAIYELQQTPNRKNYGVKDAEGGIVYLFKMTDVHLTRYRASKRSNPYIDPEQHQTQITSNSDTALINVDAAWTGQTNQNAWYEVRLKVLERDEYQCRQCGSKDALDVHHIRARRDGGSDDPDNLMTLCRTCHMKTNSFGQRKSTS